MNTASKAIAGQMLNASAAANDDRLGDQAGEPLRVEARGGHANVQELQGSAAAGIETTGGWDAYDVWRRFIKEARDRRKNQHDSN